MKMNRFFLFSLCVMLWGGLEAQITLTANDYFPEAGDTLFTVIDDLPTGVSATPPGGNQVWNYAGLQNDQTRLREVKAAAEGEQAAQFPGTEILFPQGVNAEGYYNVTPDRYELVGYAGQDPLGQGVEVVTRFSPPYIERWAPLQFFDIRSTTAALLVAVATADIPGNIFDGLPIAPDSIRVRVATQRTDVVDAWGSITIPGNHTYQVLREKRTEYRDVRLDAKVNPLPWFDITDLALQNLPIDELGRDTTVRYYYWSADAKEAIAVISFRADGVTAISAEYKGDPLMTATEDPQGAAAVALAFSPNPAGEHTQLSWRGLAAGVYQLQLYAADGRLAKQVAYPCWGQEVQTEQLPLGGLAAGTYYGRLINERGEVVAASQLVIGR